MTEPLPSAWEQDWLNYTEHEYYYRVRNIMLESGMGEGDVEMILANVWESGWIAGKRFADALRDLWRRPRIICPCGLRDKMQISRK